MRCQLEQTFQAIGSKARFHNEEAHCHNLALFCSRKRQALSKSQIIKHIDLGLINTVHHTKHTRAILNWASPTPTHAPKCTHTHGKHVPESFGIVHRTNSCSHPLAAHPCHTTRQTRLGKPARLRWHACQWPLCPPP